MNEFSAGDRVRCVDATPLPLNASGAVWEDFSFPDGFIAEGEVYVVEGVFHSGRGSAFLMLVEKRVLLLGREIPWCGVRFEPPREEAPAPARRKARSRSSIATAVPS